MTKNKSLVSIIIFLLITNIAMLIFFIKINNTAQKPQTAHDQNGISNLLKSDVGFSDEQLEKYQAIRKEHLEKVRSLFDNLKKSKENLYDLLYAPEIPDSVINNAANQIGEKQKSLDMEMFNHFKTYRLICTPD
ncbi:MAG: Spy/CpxP family protein refolding chaperone, partial [Ginsengibacter sp.]